MVQTTLTDTQTFTYDAMGNPTSYDGTTLTWEGKQLSGAGTTTFSYDENGLRTRKTVNGTVTDYYYNGSVLIGMVTGTGSTAVHQFFSYDASGNVVSVDYSSDGGSTFTTYYYLRNGQNDVVKLIDNSGDTVVEYIYDSWGRVVTTSGTLVTTLGADQPFRYLGYVYDAETGLYYVASRYYDPGVGRWINADDTDLLLEKYESILQYNLFAYCWNNPANMYDPDGYWALAIAGGGYIAATATFGTANIWNPIGWVVLGAVAVTAVVVGVNIYESVKTASSSESDPYARPGQKKQGRERKNKARRNKDWKPRSAPKPPKKHTPGREHRKYK